MKIYSNFQDIHGNAYTFSNYMDFACWWFSIPYRRSIQLFDSATYKKLSYAATKSVEARTQATA